MLKQLLSAVVIFSTVAFAPKQSPIVPQKIVTYNLNIGSEVKNPKDCQAAWSFAMSVWEMEVPSYIKFRPTRPGEIADFQVTFAPRIDENPNIMGWIRRWTTDRIRGTIQVKSDMRTDNEN